MLFRYKIKPVSPIITPLMSDTIFGHFCWAIRYEKGEKFLQDFLATYQDGNSPPVIFSSAFISGYLPRPVLPLPKRKQMTGFMEKFFINDPDGLFPKKSDKQKRFEGMSKIKEWNKRQFISLENWLALKDDYSEYRLQEMFYTHFKNGADKESVTTKSEITASNTLSRISGSVAEDGGGLFSREKIWFHHGTELDLYVMAESDESASLTGWFLTKYLPETGFGKDKSIGMGILDIKADKAFNPDIFNVVKPNACMVLSLSSFEGIGTYRSFYRLKTKFGKLGGDFAFSSPSGGAPKPFKKPLLMMEPGSVFFTTEQINAKELTGNVHSDDRIRHCGLPVTLPLKIKEDR